jgi:hypothetical protein
MARQRTINKPLMTGDMLRIHYGEYDDNVHLAFAVVLRPFDLVEQAKLYVAEHGSSYYYDGFLKCLTGESYIAIIETRSCWLGNYGDLTPEVHVIGAEYNAVVEQAQKEIDEVKSDG